MNNIHEELKEKIFEYEKLSEIGIEIYKENKDDEFLHKAIWFSSEADRLKRVLADEYYD